MDGLDPVDERVVKDAQRLQAWGRNLIAGLAGALVVGASVIGVGLLDQKSARTRDCQEIELVKTGLRETLQEAENFVTSSPVRSSAEKLQATEFYGHALARLNPRKC